MVQLSLPRRGILKTKRKEEAEAEGGSEMGEVTLKFAASVPILVCCSAGEHRLPMPVTAAQPSEGSLFSDLSLITALCLQWKMDLGTDPWL